jgi:hypothetical protein
MKNFLMVMLTVVAIAICSIKNVNAQTKASVDSLKIDSVVVTHNTATVWLHVYGLTANAFWCVSYGPGSAVNTYNTMYTSTSSEKEVVFVVTIPGLISDTEYSCQGKILGGVSAASLVKTFKTSICP